MKCPNCSSEKIKEKPIFLIEEDKKYTECLCKKCGDIWLVNEKGKIVDNFEDKGERNK